MPPVLDPSQSGSRRAMSEGGREETKVSDDHDKYSRFLEKRRVLREAESLAYERAAAIAQTTIIFATALLSALLASKIPDSLATALSWSIFGLVFLFAMSAHTATVEAQSLRWKSLREFYEDTQTKAAFEIRTTGTVTGLLGR